MSASGGRAGYLAAVEPIESRNLRDHVHERLRKLIVAGGVRTGEKLNERELALKLGVSTTPVKDALRILETEGLVRTEARRGVFNLFGPRRAFEMALARAALEGVMANLAARRGDEAGIAALRALVADMERATAGAALEDLVALNERFHGLINRLSGCEHLPERLDGQRMYDTAQRLALLAVPAEREAGFAEHRRIFEALAARAPADAEKRMRAHILRSARDHIRLTFPGALAAAPGPHAALDEAFQDLTDDA